VKRYCDMTSNLRKRYVRFHGCLVLAGLILTAGCGRSGPPLGTVSGQVMLDGELIGDGYILFVPMKGTKGPAAGVSIADGCYLLSGEVGAAIGLNRVEISSSGKTGRMVVNPFSPTGELMEEIAERVAPQFNSASTLTFEVKPGNNIADFDVTSIRDRRGE
jgi:hypothetical protein